jgi:hypothetical protein
MAQTHMLELHTTKNKNGGSSFCTDAEKSEILFCEKKSRDKQHMEYCHLCKTKGT